jgi:hypothetical protein
VKLIATEFDGESVQLTYTDGPAVPEAKEYVIVRLPMQGSFSDSINFHHMTVLERLHTWAGEEFKRVEKNSREGK